MFMYACKLSREYYFKIASIWIEGSCLLPDFCLVHSIIRTDIKLFLVLINSNK